MNSLTSVVEMRTPLFSHISVPRRSAPRTCRPIVPTKIKFLTSPRGEQVVIPGLYFEIPESLSMSEMETLEQAILKVIHDDPVNLSGVLDIPETLGRRLGPSTTSTLNGFLTRRNKVYLESANCILVGPNERLRPTSVDSPEYGVVVPLLEASVCLSFLASAASIDRCGQFESRALMLRRTWSKLVNSVKPYRLTKSRLERSILCVGDVEFSEFASDQSLSPALSALLCCFFWVETDLSQFLEW